MRAYKVVPVEMMASASLDHAQLQSEELLKELENWSSGLRGTNLENSQKYIDITTAIETLDRIDWEFQSLDQDVKVAVHLLMTRRKKRRTARWARLSNVVAHLQAVVDTMPEQDFGNDIEIAVSELESVEIPGMYS